MSRRRKSSSSSSKRRLLPKLSLSFAWAQSIRWPFVKRGAIVAVWLIGGGAVAASWIMGVPKLEAFASARHGVPPHEVVVRFKHPPQWIKGSLADHLLRTASIQISGDPLKRDDLVTMRQALVDTGWFDSIDQVRRTAPDMIEIEAQFVRPYTIIRDAAGHHLVDSSGKLLPKSYRRNDDLPVMHDARTGQTLPMIAISGGHFKRPAIGTVWEGADIAAGLKLMHVIDQQPWRHQIAEIDVSSVVRDGLIRLRTMSSSVILWGSAPGEEAALELPAEGKLQRLALLYQNHGRIDGGRTGELDITCEKVAVAR